MSKWSVNRLAARAVAIHAPGSLAARRELLDMLGLATPDGQITPDDTRDIELARIGDSMPERGMFDVREPMVDRSLVPPGLATLPTIPTSRAKRSKSTPRPRALTAKCGTLGGRSRHTRLGEPQCKECKEAHNAYQRAHKKKWDAERRARATDTAATPAKRARAPKEKQPLPPRPETCGTLAGRSNHLRRHEKLCPECAVVYNTHQRDVRKRRATPPDPLTPLDAVVDTKLAEWGPVPGQLMVDCVEERSA